MRESQTNNKGPDLRNNSGGNQRPQLTKSPPLCCVCNDSVSKHFLGDCETFTIFANERKKRVVVSAGRTLKDFLANQTRCLKVEVLNCANG